MLHEETNATCPSFHKNPVLCQTSVVEMGGRIQNTSKVQTPKSKIKTPKSKIQNPKHTHNKTLKNPGAPCGPAHGCISLKNQVPHVSRHSVKLCIRNVWLGPGDAGGKTRKRENAKTKHENTKTRKRENQTRKRENAKTGKRENAQIEHVARSTWNTNVITALGMCKVCTEAVHSVALGTRTLSQLWACVKYVPKQSIP